MKVGVEVYATSSRTYIVEVPDGLVGVDLEVAIAQTDSSTWERVEEWDDEPNWGEALGGREIGAVYKVDQYGDLEGEDLINDH